MIKIPHPATGTKNVGSLSIYDKVNRNNKHVAKENRTRCFGNMSFKPDGAGGGRILDLRMGSSRGHSIRLRKIQFEIIKILKDNGFSVGRRERDI